MASIFGGNLLASPFPFLALVGSALFTHSTTLPLTLTHTHIKNPEMHQSCNCLNSHTACGAHHAILEIGEPLEYG